MIKQEIQRYYQSWAHFEQYCRDKTKGRCVLTNNCWKRLRDYHLNNFLIALKSPYNFLFMVKLFHRKTYESTPSMRRYYHKYAKKHKAEMENTWGHTYLKRLKNNVV